METVGSWGPSDSDTGENSEAAGIRGLCKAAQNHAELLTG